MNKSSRHSKIAGDFGETFLLYWLSKYGYESARVDHTGIDLIAKDPDSNSVLGISVKSRTRNEGKETEHLGIKNDELDKIYKACKAFQCEPWIAFIIDAAESIQLYLMSIETFLKYSPKRETSMNFKMRPQWTKKYRHDKEVKWFELKINAKAGWNGQQEKSFTNLSKVVISLHSEERKIELHIYEEGVEVKHFGYPHSNPPSSSGIISPESANDLCHVISSVDATFPRIEISH
jgi:hypothetical protein